MLNNNHLSSFAKDALRFQPYENRIRIYDNNCLQCPFHLIGVHKKDDIIEVSSIKEAINICLYDKTANIIRSCTADNGYTLAEITSNTCSLWYDYKEIGIEEGIDY